MSGRSQIKIIIRESNINERVRLSKILQFYQDNGYEIELWKKVGTQKSNIPEKSITKTYKRKSIEYALWLSGLFFRLLFRRKITPIYVSGFESAIVVYLVSLVRGGTYIFDNPDNFYQIKNLPEPLKKLIFNVERKIIKRSKITTVPDEMRIKGYNLPREYFLTVRNFPSRSDVEKSLKNVAPKDKKLVIYMNGWLVPTRGLQMISQFIKKLQPNLDLKIKIAGKKEGLDEILTSPYLEYLGVVDAMTSLANYHNSDLVLTFYDPSIEINRNASPNKWGDALVTETIPVLNNGIQTTAIYFPKGGYFAVDYDDSESLYKLIMDIYKDETILENKRKELKENPKYFWEDQMQKTLNNDVKK
jgi:hypothetical protein